MSPPPVNSFDLAEDLNRELYHADTIARWTLVCIDGDHMSPDEARKAATEAVEHMRAGRLRFSYGTEMGEAA